MSRPPRAREPLKDAALRLFVERGVHPTGIREIAKAAEVSEAALYRHWTGKDHLVRELFTSHLEVVVGFMERALLDDGRRSHAERLRDGISVMTALYDEKPLVFRFVLLVQHEVSPLLPPDVRKPQDVLATYSAEVLGAGPRAAQAPLVAAALLGLFMETASQVVYGRLPGGFSSHREGLLDCCCRLLGLDPPL
jgi:AcrR family transcriptional regulator